MADHGRYGWPTPCPRCGEWGHLDFLDLVARTMRQSCPDCGMEWVLPESMFESPGLPDAPGRPAAHALRHGEVAGAARTARAESAGGPPSSEARPPTPARSPGTAAGSPGTPAGSPAPVGVTARPAPAVEPPPATAGHIDLGGAPADDPIAWLLESEAFG